MSGGVAAPRYCPGPYRTPPFRIGDVAIDFPVGQAALSGYSDWPMRVIARRLGAGFTLCEVLLDRFVLNVSKGRKSRRFLQVTDEEHPCGAQLMGSDPDEFAAAAKKLAAAGFDWIDINFGCPVKKVLGKCRGGSLLGDPPTALAIVAAVRDALPPRLPLTLKMRRGLDDSDASRERFFTILDGAFARGAAAVAVHGRTVQQRYQGQSSWDFLAEVKRHAGGRVVLGSGDLFTAADCLRLIEQTGVDGALAARGAIGNPWIFSQVRALAAGAPLPPPPTVAQQRAVLEEHFALAELLYGRRFCTGVMNTMGIKYSQLHPRWKDVRGAFAATRDYDGWWRVLDTWYA